MGVAPAYSHLVSTLSLEGERMGIEIGGILGLLLLILMVYAVVKIVQSGAGTGAKVLWIVLILLVPVLGLILWALFGPKG